MHLELLSVLQVRYNIQSKLQIYVVINNWFYCYSLVRRSLVSREITCSLLPVVSFLTFSLQVFD